MKIQVTANAVQKRTSAPAGTYVPDGTFTQDFNRYSYARNNPLSYVDPDGEFIFNFIAGFWKGLINNDPPFKTAFETVENQIKITAGLFTTDKRKDNFWKQSWELISRFTWQLPQTLVGNVFAQLSNHLWQVDHVDFWGGATVISGNFWGGDGGAVTLGNYILGGYSLTADPSDDLFQHEYGHYRQSQRWGPLYLPIPGFYSLLSVTTNRDGHDYCWVEENANKRAYEYFYNRMKENFAWNLGNNPIDPQWVYEFHKKQNASKKMPHNPTTITPISIYLGITNLLKPKLSNRLSNLLLLHK